MALYDQRFSQCLLAIRKMEAIQANEPMPMEGIEIGRTSAVSPIINSNSNSELSTVSSSRLSGLEEDWWKEKTGSSSGIAATAMTTAVENTETSTATATATARVMRTRSKGKRVHWK